MSNDKFFTGWGRPSYYPSEVNIKDTEEDIYSKSEDHLQFELNPKEYFESKGENCVTLIPEFLNGELIQKDPHCFTYGYNQILKEISFNENKEIALDTISQIVVSSNSNGKEVTEFILDSGLADKTERVLKILDMEEEWENLSELLDINPIEENN